MRRGPPHSRLLSAVRPGRGMVAQLAVRTSMHASYYLQCCAGMPIGWSMVLAVPARMPYLIHGTRAK